VDEIAPAEGMVALAMEQLAQHAAAAPRQVLTSRANSSKIHATLHSCMREWSEDGATERAACFDVILDALTELLPVTSTNKHQQKVLVPGAGLGRLPLEIVHRGYACQGNEFSYFMLLTSNFLLNHVEEAGMFGLYPFVEQCNNIKKIGDNVREVKVPDVCPAKLLWGEEEGEEGGEGGAAAEEKNGGEKENEQHHPSFSSSPSSVLQPPDFSMTAGEFLEVYGEQIGCWDAVVTCFFLDTAPVVIEYIEAIHRLLRPGGVWVNFGPLLYHWAGGGGGGGRGGGGGGGGVEERRARKSSTESKRVPSISKRERERESEKRGGEREGRGGREKASTESKRVPSISKSTPLIFSPET